MVLRWKSRPFRPRRIASRTSAALKRRSSTGFGKFMKTIHLQTTIPGPKSCALSKRREAAVPRGLSHATPVYVAGGPDAWLEDVDGESLLDFRGGVGSLNPGHRNVGGIFAHHAQLPSFR